MNGQLERVATNPIVRPAQITFTKASGAFNPGACVDRRNGRVVLLVRVFEEDTRRSCLALALSKDGITIDEVWPSAAVARVEPYEEWGVEDARITYLEEDALYAITYTGYSALGPRVCLITTDDLLDPARYQRHGPRIASENKNCVILPRRIAGQYVILHRPMPTIVCIRVNALESEWPVNGVELLGPKPGSWRSSRVGAGAPPIETELGWLLPFHGATSVHEGNVYSMGWMVLDRDNPEKVLYVCDAPALTPETPYEIEPGPILQVDMANFKTGVRVVFPEGLVERGEDLIVYYGAGDVSVGAARVNKVELLRSIAEEMSK